MADLVNKAARAVPVWALWVLALLPAPILLYMGATGGLGREPISALEHELGQIALQLLIAGLCITPMRRFFGINLLKFRRALGLLAFTYLAFHMSVWALLDVQVVSQMWADIVKRPYITVGMAAFLMLLPLAVTSNNRSVRAMGAGWRKLHQLVFPAALLGAVHSVMVQKVWETEPLMYLAVIVALLALRVPQMVVRLSRA
jgi:sulfoxide reductase heme-binding subunit YedZ